MTNNLKSNGSSLNKRFDQFDVKREPTVNIEQSNTCMKCSGSFSKGYVAVCPAKDINYTFCKYYGHFTRLCKSCRKNVNLVESQIVNNTDCNCPLEQPDVKNDQENKECCGVINA